MITEQRTDSDCVIACIANATGVSYEDVLAHLPKGISPGGLDWDSEAMILRELGWNPIRLFGWRMSYPCIVQVASLNFSGKLHCVYWDGNNVLDPSRRRKHTLESALVAHTSATYNHTPELDGCILHEQDMYHQHPRHRIEDGKG